jgi:hypothetical protein
MALHVPIFVRRIAKIGAVVMLAALIVGVVDNFINPRTHKTGAYKPACDGLPCREKWECGSRCVCTPVAGRDLGVCVVKGSLKK